MRRTVASFVGSARSALRFRTGSIKQYWSDHGLNPVVSGAITPGLRAQEQAGPMGRLCRHDKTP